MSLVKITKYFSKLMVLQMKKENFAIILSLAVILAWGGPTAALAKQTIKDIRFKSSSSTTDQIIFELTGPYTPVGKALPGSNPRVYFDFTNMVPSGKVKTRIPTNGNFVKQIRYAYHKGPKSKTRVVLDLLANQKMDFKQDFDNNTNTLTISIFLAGTKPDHVPPPTPEPVAVVQPEKKPKPAVVADPLPAKTTVSDVGKKVQPIGDVSIAVKPKPVPAPPPAPKPVVEKPPVQTSAPEPEPKPAPTPQVHKPKVASIPAPAPKTPDSYSLPPKEATNINPMSEVGIQKQEEALDVSPVVYSIEFDPLSKRGETISFKMNGFYPPVVFGLEEDIPRIVCFFKNASAGTALTDMINTNGQHVKNIRIGKYQNPDNIRVVLELAPGSNYDLQQVFFKDDKVFMLIINKAGTQAQSKG